MVVSGFELVRTVVGFPWGGMLGQSLAFATPGRHWAAEFVVVTTASPVHLLANNNLRMEGVNIVAQKFDIPAYSAYGVLLLSALQWKPKTWAV
ncbi:hypothetical protein EJB05_41008, partial [Eragrostis curvula]